MQRGDIVIERLTGVHVFLLERVNSEWACRFPDGRVENRYGFELMASPLVRVAAVLAEGVGSLVTLLRWMQGALVVAVPPRLVRTLPRQEEHG